MRTLLLAPLLLLAFPALAQTGTAPMQNGSDDPSSAPARARVHFVDADTDHDGRLSRTEAQAMPFVARHFDAIDTNHDGYVTREELRAAWAQTRSARAQRSGGQSGNGNAPPPSGSGG